MSNKVRTLDGRWLALDGRLLHQAKVTASEYYNTRLEARMADRLGLVFAEREAPQAGKRAVREIVGIDTRLATRWSSRRAQIAVRKGELTARFQDQHARPPTPVEALALAQQANLETRQDKHEPRSLGQQRAAWRAEAIAELGTPAAVDAMLQRVLATSPAAPRPASAGSTDVAAAQVINTVESTRATWQVWHLRAEALRIIRNARLSANDVDAGVDRLVAAAVSRCVPIGSGDGIDDPVELRRPDGSSVYDIAGGQRYTSRRILATERAIIAASQQWDGRAVNQHVIETALLESTANGTALTAGQAQLVRELAGSGLRLQLALAPAGTGKTTAIAVLAHAWTDSGGDVVGLAPSATAAAVLRDATGAHTDTLAKLCHAMDTGQLPPWAARIGTATLILVDEAGLAGTPQLARVVEFALHRGASIRLIADDQQLAAIGAGGVLRDITHAAGAVTLAHVVRFADPAEGAASLAIRAGDPAGIGYYLDHCRVHVGDHDTVVDQAYTAWATDRAAGRNTVMLAPTRQIAAILNARARADRFAYACTDAAAVTVADGQAASIGDIILTRRNDRRLALAPTDFVKNGDRWTIEHLHPDGALDVRHLRLGTRITLPSEYVRTAVELGYAATIHAAQGITSDTAHTVLSGEETRQLLYVALTRARDGNHVYLTTATDGDVHSVIRPEAVRPPTAADILAAILARDGAATSATTALCDAADPTVQLRDATARYTDALTTAAERTAPPGLPAAIDATAERLHPGLTTASAYPALRAHLLLAPNPIHALQTAFDGRDLHAARDPAAVIDRRLDTDDRGPLPWLPAISAALTTDPHWGPYLTARAHLVRDLAEQVAAIARTFTPTSAPHWARPLLDHDPDLLTDVAVWRAATGIPDEALDPTGQRQHTGLAARHQHGLDRRLTAVAAHHDAAPRWADFAHTLEPRLPADPHWPRLAAKLTAIDHAGIDVATLAADAVRDHPLPDEHAADALWWRLARHLTPAALAATERTRASLDPAWTPALTTVLGAARAKRVRADPAWPALIAVITDASHAGWQPDQLIDTAAGLATDTHGQPLPDHELAEALVWRITMLNDPAGDPPSKQLYLPTLATTPSAPRPHDPRTHATPPLSSTVRAVLATGRTHNEPQTQQDAGRRCIRPPLLGAVPSRTARHRRACRGHGGHATRATPQER